MKAILTDLLAIIGVVLNGLPQGLLALTFGFASVPTALAFFVGAVGNTITQSVAPISFQAETITYAGTAGKDRSERCTMIFIGGVIMALIGAFGLLTKIVNFVGEDVAYGMMAGVGIILVKAAIDMIKSDAISGGVSLAAALITYYFTKDSANTLVYTIVISVVASCIANAFFNKEKSSIVVEDDKFVRQKFTINANVILGALGMVCLNIGSNISFGGITAGMATGGNYNVDNLTVISSLADMFSSFFGGAPVEAIISATANAPHAVWAGCDRCNSASETASENRKICSVFFDRRFPVCTRYLQNRCTGCAVCLRCQCSRRRNHNGCHCSNKPVPRNAGRCCCKTAWIINSVT